MSSTERVADTLGCLIGNCQIVELGDAPQDFGEYDGVCLIFNFYGVVTAGRPKNFLINNAAALAEKRIACVGVGFSDSGYTKYVVDLERQTGLGPIAGYFITRENETPRTGYDIGRIMRAPVSAMPEADLARAIDDFIMEHNTLALATADGSYVRCTPLEYIYSEKLFYIITEGGNKFRGILGNGRISAAIYEQYTAMDSVEGLQFSGRAELAPYGGAEYMSVMAMKHISADVLAALPVRLYVVRVTPHTYEFTNAAFARDGYDVKQILKSDFSRAGSEAGAEFAVAQGAGGNPASAGSAERAGSSQAAAGQVTAGSGDASLPESTATAAGTAFENDGMDGKRSAALDVSGIAAALKTSQRLPGDAARETPQEDGAGEDAKEVPPLEPEPSSAERYEPRRRFIVKDKPAMKRTDTDAETPEEKPAEDDRAEETAPKKNVDEYGLPILDMSVIAGLYPREDGAAENGNGSGAPAGAAAQNWNNAAAGEEFRSGAVFAGQNGPAANGEAAEDRDGGSTGRRVAADEAESGSRTDRDAGDETAEKTRASSRRSAGRSVRESAAGRKTDGWNDALYEDDDAEEEEGYVSADEAESGKRKDRGPDQKKKSGGFFSRIGQTVGSWLKVDDDEDDDSDEDDDDYDADDGSGDDEG